MDNCIDTNYHFPTLIFSVVGPPFSYYIILFIAAAAPAAKSLCCCCCCCQVALLLLLLSRFSRVRLLATPWTAAYKAPPPMGFSRQEYCSGVPLPSPQHSTRDKQNDVLPPSLTHQHVGRLDYWTPEKPNTTYWASGPNEARKQVIWLLVHWEEGAQFGFLQKLTSMVLSGSGKM